MRSFAAVVVLAVAATPATAAAQRTAKLLHSAAVRDRPAGRVLEHLPATRPLTGAPTVVPVLRVVSEAGRDWLLVRLPRRPNGATGWIAADGTLAGEARWSVEISRGRRRAGIYRDGRRVRTFSVVVGKPATPTPLGRFFVAERVRQPRGSALGPWVLATSAYSGVLQQFGGGPGQIGLHGRTGLRGSLGSAASHGCVRFSDGAISWLAARARPGTPITIRRR
jgi:lipoprotein-anchoring transpeptidase ErfK/SrfK